ncbi:MAG: hypothetical protein CHACPFDD_01083 [Phycisphaerae bacterium]|nr:hypothetical protein [Phycisphaerae bacterium]
MRLSVLISALLLTVWTACDAGPAVGGPPSGSLFDVLTETFEAPGKGADSAAVRVEFQNASALEATANVTMRVAGEVVHRSRRRLEPHSKVITVGPDAADSVLVEVTRALPARSLPLAPYFLGKDFSAGDTIVVRIEPQPDDFPPAPPGDDPGRIESPPDDSLIVRFGGLDQNRRVSRGGRVDFSLLRQSGPAGTRVTVIADPDGLLGNGNELPVAAATLDAAETPLSWTNISAAPATYRLVAALEQEGHTYMLHVAPGRVRVNSPPEIVFDSPIDGATVKRENPLRVTWAARDLDDSATISLFIDNDANYGNGIIRIIRSEIPESDDVREELLSIADLAYDQIYVGATISDGLETVTAYAGHVVLKE